jgi:hypothetical protein
MSCGLYYKHVTIINDESSVVNKVEASLTDNARDVIYDCHMFIVQAPEQSTSLGLLWVGQSQAKGHFGSTPVKIVDNGYIPSNNFEICLI